MAFERIRASSGLHLVGIDRREALQLVVRNRLLMVQTGVSASQAKVFKAHAVPQGLCHNLIDALKLYIVTVDAGRHAFCHAVYDGIEVSGESCIIITEKGVSQQEPTS